MGAGLQKFEIILNNSDKTFSPGDTVTGRVVINVSEKTSTTGLKITCKGKAKGKWKNTKHSFLRRTTTFYTNVEDYFELESYLLGGLHGESVEINSGCHILPFMFVLPQRIPSSYKRLSILFGELAEVRYTIDAKLYLGRMSDVHSSVSLTVKAPYDLCQIPIAKIPIQDEADEVLGCFPYKAGLLTVKIFTPTCGFAIGEFIEARLGINNYSKSTTVKKIKLRLIQETQLHGPEAPTLSEVTLQKTEKLGPFEGGEPIAMCMQVPDAPSSGMPFCNVMTVRYFLEVEFVMSGLYNVPTRHPFNYNDLKCIMIILHCDNCK